jgi:hypothetical protein
MAFKPEAILNCACSIRPFLPELMGDEAAAFDQQLADLLAQAQAGQPVETQILELLKNNPKTRQWAAECLASQRVSKGFDRLPGSSGAVAAQKYVCPQGDYIWYRRSSGIPVPVCPTHGELIPADAK